MKNTEGPTHYLTQTEEMSFVGVSCIIILNPFPQKFTREGEVFIFSNRDCPLRNEHCLLYSELAGQINGKVLLFNSSC